MRYRITCIATDQSRFVLEGTFPSDWAAIDHAIACGAAVALPHRV